MSAAALGRRRNRALADDQAASPPLVVRAGSLRFRVLAVAGSAVLLVQLAVLLVWSEVRAQRYALTWDFSIYYQAWTLIARGHLDPVDTVIGFPFVQNHAELLLWPLASLALLWPQPLTLLVVQCVAIVAAEAVAFLWICELARSGSVAGDRRPTASPGRHGGWTRYLVAVLGLVLLVANPWIYWTASFDFHLEVVGGLFVVLAARDTYSNPGGRRVWLWVGLCLLSGDVVVTCVGALGVGAALAGARWRRTGLELAAVAAAWSLLILLVRWDRGSGVVSGYGYLAAGTVAGTPGALDVGQLLAGVLRHPQHLVAVLWRRRLDLYANVSSSGFIGLLSPWAVPVAVVVLIESGLNGYLGFIVPGFQDVLVYLLMPVGATLVLLRVARRSQLAALALAAVLAANSIGWAQGWIGRTSRQWLRISPAAAAVLSSIEARIGPADEVIASQGVAGPFAGRALMYAITGPGPLPLRAPAVWVIVAPTEGVEKLPVVASIRVVADLAGPLHARRVAHAAGVWVFRLRPPPGVHDLVVPEVVRALPAWTSSGAGGSIEAEGPAAAWTAVGTGVPGYVVAGDYWRELPGRFAASVELETTVRLEVELWDDSAGVLLARRSVAPRAGWIDVRLPVVPVGQLPLQAYGGRGLFRVLPVPPPPGDELEIRVWSPGVGLVMVSQLRLLRLPRR